MKNYTLIEKREIPELHATGYYYRHDKTGAKVLYLYAPDDDNQVFSISFATPPEGDMGIPHILEHCVLNGSDKYPVKEPFVELLKGSLKTFLNAMTFQDKTMFPVASRNEKDFMNLVGVYLDAVFFPNLRKDPFIFKQEGWHYELDSPESDIVYKGVVYNEMKGAFSSGDEVLQNLLNKAMYPDSIYGLESGGNPDHIPELSYEQFRDFHQRYYHPSNSYVFFYGNGDMEKHLAFVDEEYIGKFDLAAPWQIGNIGLQPRFDAAVNVRDIYSVSAEESTEDKTYLAYTVMLDPVRDAVRYHTLDICSTLLAQSESSPIKLALLKAGIGQEISSSINISCLQPSLSIIAKNADECQKDEFVSIVEEVLADVAENGFDEKLVESNISSAEFNLREANFGSLPKGIMFAVQCMDSWLYGLSPMDFLGFEKEYRFIRENTGIFRSFIRDEVISNPHKVIAVLAPEPGLNVKTDEKIRQELKNYKDSLTDEQIDQLVTDTKELKHRQQLADRPEDLARIPMLSREDLEPIKPFDGAYEKEVEGRKTSVFNDFTNNIIYLNLTFDMNHLPEKYLPYASLLTECLSMMDTTKRSYTDLDNEIGCHLGGLNIAARPLRRLDGDFNPYFEVSAKFLTEEADNAAALLKEILLDTKLGDLDRLGEIIMERLSQMEEVISYSGDKVASSRAMGYFSPYHAYNDRLGGLDFYLFVKDLAEKMEDNADEIIENMETTLSILIRQGNLRGRICVDADKQSIAESVLAEITRALPLGVSSLAEKENVRIKPEARNEGLITSGKVQYVARAGKTDPAEFNGAALVMTQILRLDYLWNKVRAQGGAYGCSGSINRHGEVVMTSYRDPNLKETIDVFENAGSALAEFTADEREMLKYVIGTLSGLDPVRTVSMRAALAFDSMESGLTGQMIHALSREVLNVTADQVRDAAKALTDAMRDPFVCVQGSESKIKENQELFDNIITLF